MSKKGNVVYYQDGEPDIQSYDSSSNNYKDFLIGYIVDIQDWEEDDIDELLEMSEDTLENQATGEEFQFVVKIVFDNNEIYSDYPDGYEEEVIEEEVIEEEVIEEVIEEEGEFSFSEKMSMIKKGDNINILIRDSDPWIRKALVGYGYGLDKLINDESRLVREEIAMNGYGLDKLINDSDNHVRTEVANQGYGLDKLINDNNKEVLEYVNMVLDDDYNGSLEEWALANPDKVHDINFLEDLAK